jgi:hypothetical protein
MKLQRPRLAPPNPTAYAAYDSGSNDVTIYSLYCTALITPSLLESQIESQLQVQGVHSMTSTARVASIGLKGSTQMSQITITWARPVTSGVTANSQRTPGLRLLPQPCHLPC